MTDMIGSIWESEEGIISTVLDILDSPINDYVQVLMLVLYSPHSWLVHGDTCLTYLDFLAHPRYTRVY